MSLEYSIIFNNLNTRVETITNRRYPKKSPYLPEDSDRLEYNNTYRWEPGSTSLGSIRNANQYEVIQEFILELRYSTTVSGTISTTFNNLHKERQRLIGSLVTNSVSGTRFTEWLNSEWDYLNEDPERIVDRSLFNISYMVSY